MAGTIKLDGTTFLSKSGSDFTLNNVTDIGTVTSGTYNGALGTSATVPASIGSSMVLIKKVDISGSPTTINFDHSASDVTFDTTYDNYYFIVNNATPAATNKHFYVDVRTNGTDNNSVRGGVELHYNNGSGTGETRQAFASNFFTAEGVEDNDDYGGVCMTFTLFEPADANSRTRGSGHLIYVRDNGYTYNGSMGSDTRARTSINGVRFHWQGGTAFKNNGSIVMYGIKNA